MSTVYLDSDWILNPVSATECSLSTLIFLIGNTDTYQHWVKCSELHPSSLSGSLPSLPFSDFSFPCTLNQSFFFWIFLDLSELKYIQKKIRLKTQTDKVKHKLP